MKFIETSLSGCFIMEPNKLVDERGVFARTFCKREFSKIKFDKEFVQFNHSFNKYKGTIRGMHFQKPPFSETKLIRCINGSVFDVAVDLRADSPTFLQYFGVVLSAEAMNSILIPPGFAHGFQTLEDNVALIYHHTEYFTPSADSGICYNDPALKIEWKLPLTVISEKDKSYKQIDRNFKGITI